MPPVEIPKQAWKRRYDQILEEPGENFKLSFDLMLSMLPQIMRIRSYENRMRKIGREPIDWTTGPRPGPVMGVPIGGIGGGAMNRGWRGDFPRASMHPGKLVYGDIAANAFSAYVRREGKTRVVALRDERPESGALAGWNWAVNPKKTTYHALFPRAWTTYNGVDSGINLTCRQISPFIPHNYKESSYPAGVFVWTIENTGEDSATVGLMFTLQNGIDGENDRLGGHWNQSFTTDQATGVLLHHKARLNRWPEHIEDDDNPFYEDPLTFAIAAKAADGVTLSHRSRWITTSSGMDIWGDFREDGKLENRDDEKPVGEDTMIGGAVAAQVVVPAGQTREVVFSVAWDMPIARFGSGSAHYRRYTRFYGKDGNAAQQIATDALMQYEAWETAIDAWQRPILEDQTTPDWYKTALFNELYYIVDGGTIWTDGEVGEDPLGENEQGHFGYLEGHEYRMYNTYDVHFYASWALAMLFPEIQLGIQRDFANAVLESDDEIVKMERTNERAERKVRGAIPHDLGGPQEDPWYKLNIYNLSDTSEWKDLNAKFALQVYRDYVLTKREDFLQEVWPSVKEAMKFIEDADLDEDGLIENTGPDQTYDTWEMHGPSAYCGGLWLGALQVTALMADKMNEPDLAARYRKMLEKGKDSYDELLWADDYYAFDTSPGRPGQAIMAGALSGHWYIRSMGLEPFLPTAHVRSHLETVYEFNVQQFEDGEMGAVNGMLPNGQVLTGNLQPPEVWSGTTFSLAATMILEGMHEEAWKTARGIYQMTYHELGYWFATPEAWQGSGDYRALTYMRPLAIWAMQWALEKSPSSVAAVEQSEPDEQAEAESES